VTYQTVANVLLCIGLVYSPEIIEQMVINKRAGFVYPPLNRTVQGIDSIRTGEFFIWLARQPDLSIKAVEEMEVNVSEQGSPAKTNFGIQPICTLVTRYRNYDGMRTVFKNRQPIQVEAHKRDVLSDHLITFISTKDIRLADNGSFPKPAMILLPILLDPAMISYTIAALYRYTHKPKMGSTTCPNWSDEVCFFPIEETNRKNRKGQTHCDVTYIAMVTWGT
jgi:hypothetical protein